MVITPLHLFHSLSVLIWRQEDLDSLKKNEKGENQKVGKTVIIYFIPPSPHPRRFGKDGLYQGSPGKRQMARRYPQRCDEMWGHPGGGRAIAALGPREDLRLAERLANCPGHTDSGQSLVRLSPLIS